MDHDREPESPCGTIPFFFFFSSNAIVTAVTEVVQLPVHY